MAWSGARQRWACLAVPATSSSLVDHRRLSRRRCPLRPPPVARRIDKLPAGVRPRSRPPTEAPAVQVLTRDDFVLRAVRSEDLDPGGGLAVDGAGPIVCLPREGGCHAADDISRGFGYRPHSGRDGAVPPAAKCAAAVPLITPPMVPQPGGADRSAQFCARQRRYRHADQGMTARGRAGPCRILARQHRPRPRIWHRSQILVQGFSPGSQVGGTLFPHHGLAEFARAFPVEPARCLARTPRTRPGKGLWPWAQGGGHGGAGPRGHDPPRTRTDPSGHP